MNRRFRFDVFLLKILWINDKSRWFFSQIYRKRWNNFLSNDLFDYIYNTISICFFLTIEFVFVLTISTIFLRIILKCRDVDLSIVWLLIIFDWNFFKSTIITLKLRIVSIFSFFEIVFRVFLKLISVEFREKKNVYLSKFWQNFHDELLTRFQK